MTRPSPTPKLQRQRWVPVSAWLIPFALGGRDQRDNDWLIAHDIVPSVTDRINNLVNDAFWDQGARAILRIEDWNKSIAWRIEDAP